MATREQVPALTGLRGIAVLLVVNAHYTSWCSPFALQGTSEYYLRASMGTSSFGMTLFFTLSGWVITYHYLEFGWRDAPGATFLRFLFLRLSRLYPVLLLFFALQLKRIAIDSDFYGGHLLRPAIIHFLSLQSWYPAKLNGTLADGDGFSLSWSISTEIGMYLMFACAVMAFSRFRRANTILAIGAATYFFAIVLAVLFYGDVAATLAQLPTVYEPLDPGFGWRWFYYLSPYFRFAEFILGGAAAVIVIKGWDGKFRPILSPMATLGLFGLLYLYGRNVLSNSPTPAVADLLQATCFAVLMANARAGTRINAVLSSRLLLFFGAISYSLYLFHGMPTMFAGATPIAPFAWRLYAQYLFNYGLSLFFAAAIAWALYNLVEMPAQKALRRFLPAKRRMSAGEPTVGFEAPVPIAR